MSETAPSSQVLHLGAHGSQVVDTTVLAGGVVGIVVRLMNILPTMTNVFSSNTDPFINISFSNFDVLKEGLHTSASHRQICTHR